MTEAAGIRQQALTLTFHAAFQQARAVHLSGEWRDLGYDSFQEYIDATRGPVQIRLDPEQRREMVAELTAEGVPTTDQAALLGVGKRTVERDRAATNDGNDDEPEHVDGDGQTTDVVDAPDPDILDGHPDVDDQIEIIKAGRFAANVRKVFGSVTKGRAKLGVDRIGEVATQLPDFDKQIRADIAWAREWFDLIEAALPKNHIRRVK